MEKKFTNKGKLSMRRFTELSWNRLVFDSASLICSIGHNDRWGKNQSIVGLPWCNMNSKVQIAGKGNKGFYGSEKPIWNEINWQKHFLIAITAAKTVKTTPTNAPWRQLVLVLVQGVLGLRFWVFFLETPVNWFYGSVACIRDGTSD